MQMCWQHFHANLNSLCLYLTTQLEELESQRANILDEQQKFSSQKLLQLEKENKVGFRTPGLVFPLT